jgi:hypothetical protein
LPTYQVPDDEQHGRRQNSRRCFEVEGFHGAV